MVANRRVVRLELNNYGVTPGSEWVEARQLQQGYSIVTWDSFLFRRPHRCHFFREPYSWRSFAKHLPNLFGNDRLNPDEEAAKEIRVIGEKGLVAEVLRWSYASAGGLLPDWVDLIIKQRDETLADLEAAMDFPITEEIFDLLVNIPWMIKELKLEQDLGDLARSRLPGNRIDLRKIHQDLEHRIEEVETESRALIASFEHEFQAILEPFDGRRTRGGGITAPSDRDRIRSYLISYIRRHKKMPRGIHHVKSDGGMFGARDFGLIKFGDDGE